MNRAGARAVPRAGMVDVEPQGERFDDWGRLGLLGLAGLATCAAGRSAR